MRDDDEAESDREGEPGHRHDGRLEPPGQQQVGDEDDRDELDARREPRPEALPPAVVRLAQVPDDQREQQEVDLPEEDGAEYRLDEQPRRGARQHAADLDPAVAIAERVHREPRGDQQEGQVRQFGEPGQHRPRDERDPGEEHRGERRVRELERVRVVRGVPVVQRLPVVGRADVPDDEAAVAVYAQVDREEGVPGRPAERVDEPPANRDHEHDRAYDEHASARDLFPRRDRPQTFQYRAHPRHLIEVTGRTWRTAVSYTHLTLPTIYS